MTFWFYTAAVFWGFYLLNHSDLFAPIRGWIYPRIGYHVSYALQCAFCATSWITLGVVLSGRAPVSWLFAAPVVNLFAIKIFHYLTPTNKP
jgi:hypothetical protein